MSRKIGCKPGRVKGPDGKCYPGFKTKEWALVESVGDLQIYKGDVDLRNWRGTLTSGEGNWQPPSIQICQDNMKSMEESNVKIFFDISDLKRKKWENKDLPEV